MQRFHHLLEARTVPHTKCGEEDKTLRLVYSKLPKLVSEHFILIYVFDFAIYYFNRQGERALALNGLSIMLLD
jgi:hypothetical protein